MVDTIEGEWDDSVQGDNPQLLSQGEYSVDINGYDLLPIQSISYSPSISSVKKGRISVLVPPSDFNQVIGKDCQVYVGQDIIIDGEIKKINADRDNEEVELVIHPIGLDLKKESVDIKADDFILQDFIAKVIDEYNEIDDFETDIYATSNTTYTNVGSDSSELELLYVKGIFDGGMDITIDDGTNTYTESYQSTSPKVGEWIKVDPGSTFDGNSNSYDITFNPGSGSKLAIWRAMRTLEIERTIHPMNVGTFTTEQSVAYANDNDSWNDVVDKDSTEDSWDNLPITIEYGELKQQKIRHWVLTSDSPASDGPSSDNSGFRSTNFNENPYVDTAVKDYAVYLNSDKHWVEFTWENEYDMPRFAINMRYYMYEGDSEEVPSPFEGYRFDLKLDGEVIRENVKFKDLDMRTTDTHSHSENFDWGRVLQRSGLEKGEHTFRIEVAQDNGFTNDDKHSGIVIDCIVARDYVYSTTYGFDNSLDSDNLLSSPGEYWGSESVDLQNISVGYAVDEVTIDGEFNHTENLQEIGTELPDNRTSSNTSTDTYQYTGIESINSDIKVVVRLSAGEKDTDRPPTLNNKRNVLSSLEVKARGSNIPLVNGTNVTGNRLSVITDETDGSEIYFRMDGNEVVVMQRGSLKTSPNLRKESVESSVDIEGSYASCQVIGRRQGPDTGMRFGTQDVKGDIIEAENAPNIVDDHKIIEDKSKTTKKACNEKAVSFLAENARIKYDGRIETLPTFAPLGEDIDGAVFSHGEDMMIEAVDYSMDGTTITFGREHDFSKQLVDMIKKSSKNSRGI